MAREYDAFTAEYYAQYDSTISRGETRIPICFCIDVSSSMGFITNRPEDYIVEDGPSFTEDGVSDVRTVRFRPGKVGHTRIDEVRRVMGEFLGRIRYNPSLSRSAVVCIVTFSRFADCAFEFSEARNIPERLLDQIRVGADQTNAARGLSMALERLDAMGRSLRDAGNESYRPVLVFLSDGTPTDGAAADRARDEIRERSNAGRLNVIPVAIGRNLDYSWMRRLSREGRVYQMEHEDEFDEVFDQISRRVARTAAVISVDEGLVADSDAAAPAEDAGPSSAYGSTASMDELVAMFREFGV